MKLVSKLTNSTCPTPVSDMSANDLGIGITLQHLLAIFALICTGIIALSSLFLIYKHLSRYTKPDEQRQIIRLILTPLVFSVFYMLGLIFYDAAEYVQPLPDLYESYGLACLFVLFVHYAQAEPDSLMTGWKNGSAAGPGAGFEDADLKWLNKCWIMVFQLPLVKTILTIAQLASTATGTYCIGSNSVHFAHIWIVVIGSISLTFCVLTLLRFYQRFKSSMPASAHPFGQFLSFKLIVGLVFLQTLVFNFIHTPSGLSSNGTVAPRDIKYGIPYALTCFEMVLFSAAFHLVFRTRNYRYAAAAAPSAYEGGSYGAGGAASPARLSFLDAVLDALNPMDMFRHFVHAVAAMRGKQERPPKYRPQPAPQGHSYAHDRVPLQSAAGGLAVPKRTDDDSDSDVESHVEPEQPGHSYQSVQGHERGRY